MTKKTYFLLFSSMLLSACSIIYELLLANNLGLLTGSYIWWHAITVAIYLAGMGHGVWRISEVQTEKSWTDLIKAEFILAFLGSISMAYIIVFKGIHQGLTLTHFLLSDLQFDAFYFLKVLDTYIFLFFSQVLVYFIGLYTGKELPALIEITNKIENKNLENKVLFFNYLGTLFGTLFYSYILYPRFDLFEASIGIALINLVMALILYFLCPKKDRPAPRKSFIIGLCTFVIAVPLFQNRESFMQYYLKVFYLFEKKVVLGHETASSFFSELKNYPDIKRERTLYQYIDEFTFINRDNDVDTVLALNYANQFSSVHERDYHEGFAHVPLMVTNTRPSNVLVLGAGDGLLIRELLKHDFIQKITHIELDPAMVEKFKTDPYYTELNQNALSSPKVNTIIADGYSYMRGNTEIYDAIYIDFPLPKNYNLARLYSVEFYTFIKRSLKDDGFMVFDAPFRYRTDPNVDRLGPRVKVVRVLDEEDVLRNSILASTVHYADFKSLFPFSIGVNSFMLAKKSDSPYDLSLSPIDKNLFNKVKEYEVLEIKKQFYPYDISKKHINSIFAPKLISKLVQ